MTITGIILEVGDERTFEVPAATGGKKKMTAREIIIQSGNNIFVADAYDSVAHLFDDVRLTCRDAVIAELRFDEHTVKTKDGNFFYQQQVTLVAVQPAFNPDIKSF